MSRYAGKTGTLTYNGQKVMEISNCTVETTETNIKTVGFGHDFPQRTPIELDWKCDIEAFLSPQSTMDMFSAVALGYLNATGFVLTVYDAQANMPRGSVMGSVILVQGPVRPANSSRDMSES